MRLIYNKYITESSQIQYSISTNSSNVNNFTISEAITFFNLPFIIILENSDNDGYFLDALIREFTKKSKKIKRFKENNWLSYGYGNLGGRGNIIHFIDGIRKDYNFDNRFLKLFVLFDSDLEYPQNPNPKTKKIEQYLTQNNVPYHFLEKREIENYLPDNLIESIDISDLFVKVYCKKLTEVQKDFIDIEKGLTMSVDVLKVKKPEVYQLFVNENDNDKEIGNKFRDLRTGLSGKFNNFKNEFPKLFEGAKQEGLMDRCKEQINPNELRDILDKISKLL